jgi:Ca-activated chloride channel homolog
MGGKLGARRGRANGRPRRGAMLVFVTVALVLLFVGAVFSVDIAYMFLAREQLHVATDAAAKAAVVALAQGSTTQQATNTAVTYASKNAVCGSGLTLAGSNVSLGRVVYAENGAWTFSSGGSPLIAAQVTGSVSVPLFFAPVLGIKKFTTQTSSTAAFVRNKWCLVFDRSGSMCFDMSGSEWVFPSPVGYLYGYPGSYWNPYYPHPDNSRLANLNTGTTTFLDALTHSPGGTASNEVGMVTFGESATSDCTFTSNYSTIKTQLGSYLTTNIWSSGIANAGTNLSAGLQAAVDMFINDEKTDKTVWNKIIIVFSDGQANKGYNPVTGQSYTNSWQYQTPTMVSQAGTNSITIYTVGLLQQANNSVLQQLPTQTGGKYYYVTDPAGVQAAFKALAQTIPVILTH